MYCKQCKTEIEEDSIYCYKCGTKIRDESIQKMYCRKCGKSIDYDSKYCMFCGAELTVTELKEEHKEEGTGQGYDKSTRQVEKPVFLINFRKFVLIAFMLLLVFEVFSIIKWTAIGVGVSYFLIHFIVFILSIISILFFFNGTYWQKKVFMLTTGLVLAEKILDFNFKNYNYISNINIFFIILFTLILIIIIKNRDLIEFLNKNEIRNLRNIVKL